MTAQHPIITYRLRSNGTIPTFLCNHPGAFAGMYGVNTNKPGYIPTWLPPQETKFLGMGCGPIDPESGPPLGVEVIETKQELQDYISGISTDWTVDSEGVTGIRTETTTGTSEAWNNGVGLTTTTTNKVTSNAPSGTIIEHSVGYVTKIVTEIQTPSGTTTSTQEFEINHPYTNITITGTTDSVGIVTTAGQNNEVITTTTTTTTTTAIHQDIRENYSDSFTTVDVDGQITKTRVRTYTERTKVRNPFDAIAATNELWSKYELVNEL